MPPPRAVTGMRSRAAAAATVATSALVAGSTTMSAVRPFSARRSTGLTVKRSRLRFFSASGSRSATMSPMAAANSSMG